MRRLMRELNSNDMPMPIKASSLHPSAAMHLKKSILKYYRSVFKNVLEIQIASSGGPVNKILLDVSSPSDWRNAKKFIEIYEDKNLSECSSIIRITTGKKQTDTEEPVIAGGAKGVSDIKEDKAITPASGRKKPSASARM